MNAKHDLKNRYLHLDYKNIQESKSATEDASKCKNCTLDCTLEELAVLRVIEKNPKVTQKMLASVIGKSERTVKARMNNLQEKGYICRENGKRNGNWKLLVTIN
jgi:predicted HTH transcriptional regulator